MDDGLIAINLVTLDEYRGERVMFCRSRPLVYETPESGYIIGVELLNHLFT